MKIGFDYWQVISHYPEKIGYLMMFLDVMPHTEIHVISAIGKGRIGTIKGDVYKSFIKAGFMNPHKIVAPANIHEVVFESAKQSPELKLKKCQELGLDVFFDDRADVCELLNKNGILAMQVHRKESTKNDIKAERK